MRYINIGNLALPAGWETKAQAVLDQLKAAPTPEARKDIINKKSALWGEMKDSLSALSHNKCWYCDTQQTRSDGAVDHFRPKSKVAECEEHEGYWWLAFDWRNYRYSCTFCNSRRKGKDTKGHDTSGGKQDHFPLVNEDDRAMTLGDNIYLEHPMFLDPTNPNDPELLWFYNDGISTPRFDRDNHKTNYERARISIELYHLNEVRLTERRCTLYQQLSDLVEEGDEVLDDVMQARNDADKKRAGERFARVGKKLKEAIHDTTELSSVAKIFLYTLATSSQDRQRNWIKRLVELNK